MKDLREVKDSKEAQEVRRYQVAAFLGTLLTLPLLLISCGGNGNSGSYAPRSTLPPPPTSPHPFNISVFGPSSIAGTVGQFTGPLSVLVIDSSTGKPADNVNVAFRSAAPYPTWGPFGLGNTLSGDGTWQVSVAGTGVAAVGCVPAIVGIVEVTATVIPRVASIPTPADTSNVVTFSVTGQ